MKRPAVGDLRPMLDGRIVPEDCPPEEARDRGLLLEKLIAELTVLRVRYAIAAGKDSTEANALTAAVTNGSSLLTVSEAAALLRTTPQAIYAKARRPDWKDFTTKPGRQLLFEEAGLQRWLSRQSR